MRMSVVALCGVFLAAPAFAQPSAGTPDAAPSSPAPAAQGASNAGDHARVEPHQICRRIVSDSSRRLGSRLVCHTEQEWRALQNDD